MKCLTWIAAGLVGVIGCLPFGAVAQSMQAGYVTAEIGAAGGGESTRLMCPDGQLLTGLTIRAGEWLSHITLRCVAVDGSGNWIGAPQPGPDIGGTGGNRIQTADCDADTYVDTYGGNLALVHGGDTYIGSLDLACARLAATESTVGFNAGAGRASGNPNDEVDYPNAAETAVNLDNNSSCLPHWAAAGILVRTGDDRDINRFGLVCQQHSFRRLDPVIASTRPSDPGSAPPPAQPETPPETHEFSTVPQRVEMNCPAGMRIAGLSMPYEGSNAIEDVSLWCQLFDAGGRWVGPHSLVMQTQVEHDFSPLLERAFVPMCPTDMVTLRLDEWALPPTQDHPYGGILGAAPICTPMSGATRVRADDHGHGFDHLAWPAMSPTSVGESGDARPCGLQQGPLDGGASGLAIWVARAGPTSPWTRVSRIELICAVAGQGPDLTRLPPAPTCRQNPDLCATVPPCPQVTVDPGVGEGGEGGITHNPNCNPPSNQNPGLRPGISDRPPEGPCDREPDLCDQQPPCHVSVTPGLGKTPDGGISESGDCGQDPEPPGHPGRPTPPSGVDVYDPTAERPGHRPPIPYLPSRPPPPVVTTQPPPPPPSGVCHRNPAACATGATTGVQVR